MNTNIEKCWVFVSRAITHECLSDLFRSFDTKRITAMEDIFTKLFIQFFRYLLMMGITYGFHHQDLHQGNLIYRYDINQLAIIDFGRAYFGKYTTTDNAAINERLCEELTKLNFHNHPNKYIRTKLKSVKKYKHLFNGITYSHNDLLPDFCYIQPTFIRLRSDPSNTMTAYGMIIFDHITLALIMYSNFIKFLKFTSKDMLLSRVTKEFDNILKFTNEANYKDFKINYNQSNIEELLKEYKRIVFDFLDKINSSDHLFPYKNFLKIILDGLLAVALFLIGFNCKTNDKNIIHYGTYIIIISDGSEKLKIIKYIYHILNKYLSFFTDCDHYFRYIFYLDSNYQDLYLEYMTSEDFLMNINKSSSAAISGGRKKKTKKGGATEIVSNEETISVDKDAKKIEKIIDPREMFLNIVKEAAKRIKQTEKIEQTEKQEEEIDDEYEKLEQMYINTYDSKIIVKRETTGPTTPIVLTIDDESKDESKDELSYEGGFKKKNINKKIKKLKKYIYK